MHDHLPPDLARLGDQLAAATARAGARQQRRKKLLARLGATGAAAALALGVFAPGTTDATPDRLARRLAVH